MEQLYRKRIYPESLKNTVLLVNYGLPELQLPEGVYVEKIGEYQGHSVVKTVDQRAIFRGQVVHAGYLSNYAYGYAIAAANWYKGMTEFG